jgi:hypothetical protein
MNDCFCGLDNDSWLAVQRFEERNDKSARRVELTERIAGIAGDSVDTIQFCFNRESMVN